MTVSAFKRATLVSLFCNILFDFFINVSLLRNSFLASGLFVCEWRLVGDVFLLFCDTIGYAHHFDRRPGTAKTLGSRSQLYTE